MVSTRSSRTKPVVKPNPKPHKALKNQTKTGKQAKPEIKKKVTAKNVKAKAAVNSGKKQRISVAQAPKAPAKTPKTVKKNESAKDKAPKASIVSKSPVSTKGSSIFPHYTIAQFDTFKKYQEELNEKKLPELKDMCRKNLMKVSGTKAEVIERISDARILGVIPKCPKCGGGRPKLDPKTMTYYCSGYLEDVDFINCHSTFSYSSITRTPWQS